MIRISNFILNRPSLPVFNNFPIKLTIGYYLEPLFGKSDVRHGLSQFLMGF